MGSKFAACMWIYTKEALTGRQILDREQEEYLKKRMMSIMLCTNWVCAGAFIDHECVSSKTIFQQEEKFAWYKKDFWVFSATTNFNRILGSDLKVKEYQEVVNNATMDSILRRFSGNGSPKSSLLNSVARVLQRTQKTKELIKR